MYESLEEIKEIVILVGIDNNKGVMPVERCLDELAELVRTSGAVVCDRLIQKREGVHPAHYLGKGKVAELKDLITLNNATGIICDDELSPAQLRNMSEMLETKIMDRTMLILDIFAKNAGSAEAIVQVELAQLRYRLSHLSGIGKALSKLGGGIGTRGPGEKKLESDRRYIRSRISELESELKEIETARKVSRSKRERKSIPIISTVGYTNAGKSTLMNILSNAGVLAEDKLFATLDTTMRKITLNGGSEVLFSDTVGFIQKIPHNLIKAFRATLEELKYADILIHVVDANNPMYKEQMEVVYKTLSSLDCHQKPIITVFNKIDIVGDRPFPGDTAALYTIPISAKTGEGISQLQDTIENILKTFRKKISVVIPYNKGGLLNSVHGTSEIIKEEHQEDGTYIEAYVNDEIYNKIMEL